MHLLQGCILALAAASYYAALPRLGSSSCRVCQAGIILQDLQCVGLIVHSAAPSVTVALTAVFVTHILTLTLFFAFCKASSVDALMVVVHVTVSSNHGS
jgi:hypothetical protein